MTAQSYVFAARRKVLVAHYHRDKLLEAVEVERESSSSDRDPCTGEAVPGVAVQAHLEGLLNSIFAIPDQLAGALNGYLELGLRGQGVTLKGVADSPAGSVSSAALSWAKSIEPLRTLRNAMTHRHHRKTPSGPVDILEVSDDSIPDSRPWALSDLIVLVSGTIDEAGKHIEDIERLVSGTAANTS